MDLHALTRKLAKIRDPEVGSGSMNPENSWEAEKCYRKHHCETFPLAFTTFWVKLSIKFANKHLEQFQRIHVYILGGKIEKNFFLKIVLQVDP